MSRRAEPLVKILGGEVVGDYPHGLRQAAEANGYSLKGMQELTHNGNPSSHDGALYMKREKWEAFHREPEQAQAVQTAEPPQEPEAQPASPEPARPEPVPCPGRTITGEAWICGYVTSGCYYCQVMDPKSCRIHQMHMERKEAK